MALKYTEAAAELRNALIAGFTDLPIIWPNQDIDPTTDTPDGFAYCEVESDGSVSVELGARDPGAYNDSGEVRVWLFVPPGQMVGGMEDHAEKVRAIFKNAAFVGKDLWVTRTSIAGGIHVDRLPTGHEARWFASLVVIEFRFHRVE